MKKIFLLFLFLANLSLLCATPTKGKCGKNIKWRYDKTEQTLYIEGYGDMKQYYYGGLERYDERPWKKINSKIKKIVVSEGITSISEKAFKNCSVQEIIFPTKTKCIIKDWAFAGCRNITHLHITQGIKRIEWGAFEDCYNLTKIDFDNGIESIGGHSFINCNKLEKIFIPATMDFCASAFFLCKSLRWIDVDKNHKKYCSYYGWLCSKDTTVLYSIPQNYKGYLEHLSIVHDLYDDGSLNSIYLLGRYNTDYDRNRSLMILPPIKRIAGESMICLDDIEHIIFGVGIDTIWGGAIKYCRNLKSIYFPHTLKSLSKGGACFVSSIPKNTVFFINSKNPKFRDFNYRYENPGTSYWKYAVKDYGSPNSITCYVPNGALQFYKNDPIWNQLYLKPFDQKKFDNFDFVYDIDEKNETFTVVNFTEVYKSFNEYTKKIVKPYCPLKNLRLKIKVKQDDVYLADYIDLGLPSKTLWKKQNEEGFYTYDQAIAKFGKNMPTYEQLNELKNSCRWTWRGNGYDVEGPNGNKVFFPAAGLRYCYGSVDAVGSLGDYWSSTPYESDLARYLCFSSSGVYGMGRGYRCLGLSVRLVR